MSYTCRGKKIKDHSKNFFRDGIAMFDLYWTNHIHVKKDVLMDRTLDWEQQKESFCVLFQDEVYISGFLFSLCPKSSTL